MTQIKRFVLMNLGDMQGKVIDTQSDSPIPVYIGDYDVAKQIAEQRNAGHIQQFEMLEQLIVCLVGQFIREHRHESLPWRIAPVREDSHAKEVIDNQGRRVVRVDNMEMASHVIETAEHLLGRTDLVVSTGSAAR